MNCHKRASRALLLLSACCSVSSFAPTAPVALSAHRRMTCGLRMADDSYATSNGLAKQVVSGLTALVNRVMNRDVDEVAPLAGIPF